MPTGHHKSLKRKVHGIVDQISDDFSDFSLSSPATKIRRLHGELPPIVEEHEQEEHEPLPNEERALVLFKPFLPHSPDYNNSSFSLTLNSDLISQIKTSMSFFLNYGIVNLLLLLLRLILILILINCRSSFVVKTM